MDDKEAIQVSVMCLAYNHEKYIRKTLEGFVNQETSFQFEILIHDDASTDGTAAIIAEYAEKYPELIKPIYQTENQYSKGIKIQKTYNYPRAKGKYFAWCEGDDYWCDSQKLQKQFDAMEAHPECSMCVHKVQCVNEDGSLSRATFPDKRYGFKRDGVLSDEEAAYAIWEKDLPLPFQTSSYFIRRSAIGDIIMTSMPDYARYMYGDYVLVFTAPSRGHIYFINQIMSCYRLFSEGSHTSRVREEATADRYHTILRPAEGALLYDDYTSGRFHDWIVCFVSNRVVRCGSYDQTLMDEFLEKHQLTKKYVLSHCSAKSKMKYFLSRYARPLYSRLRDAADS